MKNFFKILGVILIIAGSILAAFTEIPVAEYSGIAVAALGLALAIVSVWTSSSKKTWKEAVAIIAFAVGGLLCGFSQMSADTVSQLILAVFGVVSLIVGIIVTLVKSKESAQLLLKGQGKANNFPLKCFMTIYSVCVGKYKSVAESKSDDKKIKSYGITSYLFKIDDCYTLKIFTTPAEEKAKSLCNYFKKLGLPAFVC